MQQSNLPPQVIECMNHNLKLMRSKHTVDKAGNVTLKEMSEAEMYLRGLPTYMHISNSHHLRSEMKRDPMVIRYDLIIRIGIIAYLLLYLVPFGIRFYS